VEAMKMQNEIRAPHGGRIVRIGVTEGWTVEVGSVLVVLG
jgi:biotin carboxyl carrier protein